MAGRISGDNKYVDTEGVWRWDHGNKPLTPDEMVQHGIVEMPKIEWPAAGSTDFPILDWMAANGIDRDSVMFEPICVVDDQIVYYTDWYDEPGRFALHGGEILLRQRTAPMIVEPAPGMLEAGNRAFRRERIRSAIQDLVRGL